MDKPSHHSHSKEKEFKSHEAHKAQAPSSIRCMVITVSDTRKEETDISGKSIQEHLIKNGHQVVAYQIVKDEAQEIQNLLRQGVANPEVQVIIFNGGTGIAPRDVTYEALERLLDKKIDGFGEIFRYLSYKEIGSAAILSRALAGVCNRKIVFSIPGSPGAVELAMRELILPEMGHLVREANKEVSLNSDQL
ncbi:MAG TPA: MogA/MoaB family molybdenum cofactor biosynthesis protein [Candidatus Limnocylindrales bacterium]|nr:MogA/MoaB family molybdenum cofactor biosynthesis protein [Candidatus Limnocylindrales bacterium]